MARNRSPRSPDAKTPRRRQAAQMLAAPLPVRPRPAKVARSRWRVIAIAAVATMTLAFGAAYWLLPGPGELLSFCSARQQCGYIDPDGQIVVPARYEAAGDWVRDAGRVWSGGKVGSIDRAGNVITPTQYA